MSACLNDMQHKKLLYVPGLISLIGLPLLLLVMEPEDPELPPYGTKLRFFLTTEEPDGGMDYSDAGILKKTKGKKINTVEFWNENIYIDDGDGYRHDIKLEFIEQEIRRMTALYDTSMVLKIELGQGFSYGEFHWLTGQMGLYRIEQYALVHNSFYIFPNPLSGPPRKPQILEPIYLPFGYNDVKPAILRESWWQRSWVQMQGEAELVYWTMSQDYTVTAGFIILILIPFFLRIRKYRHFIRIPAF